VPLLVSAITGLVPQSNIYDSQTVYLVSCFKKQAFLAVFVKIAQKFFFFSTAHRNCDVCVDGKVSDVKKLH
jgi:hypothetical protein